MWNCILIFRFFLGSNFWFRLTTALVLIPWFSLFQLYTLLSFLRRIARSLNYFIQSYFSMHFNYFFIFPIPTFWAISLIIIYYLFFVFCFTGRFSWSVSFLLCQWKFFFFFNNFFIFYSTNLFAILIFLIPSRSFYLLSAAWWSLSFLRSFWTTSLGELLLQF